MGRGADWIYFQGRARSKSGKTRIWRVEDAAERVLGEVRWYAPWRRYCLYPKPGTVWEKNCLRTVADFCDKETDKHQSILKYGKN